MFLLNNNFLYVCTINVVHDIVEMQRLQKADRQRYLIHKGIEQLYKDLSNNDGKNVRIYLGLHFHKRRTPQGIPEMLVMLYLDFSRNFQVARRIFLCIRNL